jgi:hypothetical protein
MKRGISIVLGLAVATAACEQDPQQLPFDVGDTPTSSTVAASGGVVTHPLGASVAFMPQSLAGATAITIAPTSTPAAVSASGAAVSNASFAIGPETTPLTAPARVDLRMTAAHRGSTGAWLTSLVNVHQGTRVPYGLGEVDLATGIVRTSVSELGAMTLVQPGDGSFVTIQRQTAAAARSTPQAVPTEASTHLPSSISGRCAVTPCPADARVAVALIAPAAGLPDYDLGAVVFWNFTGALGISGAGVVSGRIDGDFPVRIRMKPSRPGSYAPVVSLPFRVTLTPNPGSVAISTPTEVTLTNMRIRIDLTGGSSFTDRDLVFTRTPAGGEVVLDRTFTFDGQPITIRAVIPVNFD